MKKRSRCLLLVMIVSVVISNAVSFVLFLGRDDEKKIKDFVVSNQEKLENIALEYINGDETISEYKGVEVKGLYLGEYPIVQFHYSGTGIVTSSTYYGFYYSKDDVPAAFQNSGYELVPVSDGEWTWDEGEGTDNGGLTKKIIDNWFYYEAWF